MQRDGILGTKGACNKMCLVILIALFPLRYSSMTEDQATISSRCRDEKMAKKMNLPFRFREKTLFENKKDSPFLTTKDPNFLKMKKNLFENNRSICNFAALGRWSTAQWTPSVRCWPGLDSLQNRWYFLRTKCFFMRTKCFSWEQTSFPENLVLFLENKVFSWEQSIFPENKVLLIDQGLTKTCSPGEALPRHQTPWEEQSGRSELQEEEARHNRRTAKPSWTGGRPSWPGTDFKLFFVFKLFLAQN